MHIISPLLRGRSLSRIRGIIDDHGKQLKEAGPSTPVSLLGLTALPSPGDKLYVITDTKKAKEVVDDRSRHARNLSLAGQELNGGTWSICKMNMILHGIRSADIKQGDTLKDPQHLDERGEVRTYDRVIANPPFSLKEWGIEVWESDPLGRAVFGLPPKSYGDYFFTRSGCSRIASEIEQKITPAFASSF